MTSADVVIHSGGDLLAAAAAARLITRLVDGNDAAGVAPDFDGPAGRVVASADEHGWNFAACGVALTRGERNAASGDVVHAPVSFPSASTIFCSPTRPTIVSTGRSEPLKNISRGMLVAPYFVASV